MAQTICKLKINRKSQPNLLSLTFWWYLNANEPYEIYAFLLTRTTLMFYADPDICGYREKKSNLPTRRFCNILTINFNENVRIAKLMFKSMIIYSLDVLNHMICKFIFWKY